MTSNRRERSRPLGAPDSISAEAVAAAMRAHARLQMGSYLAGVYDLGGALYHYGDPADDLPWNYAALAQVNEGEEDSLIDRVESFSRAHHRTPAFYIDPAIATPSLTTALERKGFVLEEEEIWMTYAAVPQEKLSLGALHIETVETAAQMDEFMEVFRDAFELPSMDDPDEITLRRAFREPPQGVRISHFIGRNNEGQPVAVASTYIADGVAGIYNVGVAMQARRRGYGVEVTRVAMANALNAGVERILLQTELNSAAQGLYERLGFQKSFVGEIWALEK